MNNEYQKPNMSIENVEGANVTKGSPGVWLLVFISRAIWVGKNVALIQNSYQVANSTGGRVV